MNRVIKSCLALSAVLAPSLRAAEPGSTITVFIYNYAALPPEVLALTEAEASRIYQQAGIEIQWLDCPLAPKDAGQFPACQVSPGPTRLALRILSRSMAERLRQAEDSFGFAMIPEDGSFAMVANVFSYDAEQLANRRGMRHGVILGHLAAHELGHALLGAGSHSPSGMMHVPWHLEELGIIAQGLLAFMPQEAERMRTNIGMRSAIERSTVRSAHLEPQRHIFTLGDYIITMDIRFSEPYAGKRLAFYDPDGGIMHVPWAGKELEEVRHGVLVFGPAEKERIGVQVLARCAAAGQPVPQTPSWEQLTQSGTELHAKGQYAEAESVFRQALEKAEESADPRRIARSLNDLAVEIHLRGDVAYAVETLRRAVAIWETLPEPASLVAGLGNLASLYNEEALYDKAEPLTRRALQIQLQISGPDDPGVASLLDTLGDIQIGLGHYADAESTLRKALNGRENVLSPTDPRLAETLIGLGSVCAVLARFREAEGFYQRAISIREKALGNQHLDTARGMNQLAQLYFLEKQYGKAEHLWTSVIHALEAALGPENPEIGAVSNNLAATYLNESRFSEAETLLHRGLSICEKSFGPDHPCVAASLTQFAAIRRREHQYGEAESLLQRALSIDEKALGPEHSKVFKILSNLGMAFYFDGQYKDAEPIFLRALKVGEQSLGPAHPEVITTLADYAALLRKLNRKKEARKIEARVRELRATSARDNPTSLEVDWRDLQHPAH